MITGLGLAQTKTTNPKDTFHLERRSRKLNLTDRGHHAVKTGKAYVDYSGLKGRIFEQTHVCMCVCMFWVIRRSDTFLQTPSCLRSVWPSGFEIPAQLCSLLYRKEPLTQFLTLFHKLFILLWPALYRIFVLDLNRNIININENNLNIYSYI